MADVDTGTAPHYREVLRKLLDRENQPLGMGYSNLDVIIGEWELCIDATIRVTEAEAEALRELIEP